MAKLEMQNIAKTYPSNSEAVKDFNLTITDREFIILVGPSGCGKSTTLRMIAGLESVTAGEIIIDGQVVNQVKPKDRDIAMVFQNYGLFPHMTVFQNIAFGLRLRRLDKSARTREVIRVATILGISELLDRRPNSLSGGQRQRVAMGRALVREPKLLLLDEPLSNLDAKLREQMRGELAKIHDQTRTTIIMVTHDQIEAMTLGNRIVVMNQGEIQQIGTPMEIYHQPRNLFVATFIGLPQMNLLQGTVRQKGDAVLVELEDGTLIHPLPEHQESLGAVDLHDREIIVGIRPEDIQPNNNELKPSDSKITGVVTRSETIGSDTYIYFESGQVKMVARTAPGNPMAVGAAASFGWNSSNVHYFDPQTELALS